MKKQIFAAICSVTMLAGAAAFAPALDFTAGSEEIVAKAVTFPIYENIGGIRWGINYSNDVNEWGGYKIVSAWNYTNITNVTIPTTVGGYPINRIGDNIFMNTGVIETVTIPNQIGIVGDNFFRNNHSLKYINISSTLTEYGHNCFLDATELRSINIPNSCYFLGDHFCENATKLQYVTIGNQLEYMGDYAFYGCNQMQGFSCSSTLMADSQWGYGIFWNNSWADNWNATHTDTIFGSGTHKFLYRYNGTPASNGSISNYTSNVEYVYDYAFGADAWTHGAEVKTLDLRHAKRIGTQAFKKLSKATVTLSRSRMKASYGNDYVNYVKAQAHPNTKFNWVA